jgi:hypothetical protein
MKKNPPMTNSTASARGLERRRLLSDNEADWNEAGKSGIREGEPGFDNQPPIQRIMKRAETLRSQDQPPQSSSARRDTSATEYMRLIGEQSKIADPKVNAITARQDSGRPRNFNLKNEEIERLPEVQAIRRLEAGHRNAVAREERRANEDRMKRTREATPPLPRGANSARPDATRTRIFERIAENGTGTMRINKRKDDLYKPD